MSGKGSKPRPIPDKQKFESNWDNIFGKPKGKQKTMEKRNSNAEKT